MRGKNAADVTVATDMTDLADRSLASLRHHHDQLEAFVSRLTPEQLVGPSGAAEWTVAQVLSHLGSGAEIMLRPVRAAIDGAPSQGPENQEIWARWDASSPEEQAAGFVEHDARLVETLESLSTDQRESLAVDLGFLPEPVPLEVAAGMRLDEVAAHAWDAQVSQDPDAEIDPQAATLLLELFSGPLGFLLGWIVKSDALTEPARVSAEGFTLVLEDAVHVEQGTTEQATASFSGPNGALARLLTGRLKPEHTPADVQVGGNVTLDDLRRVFPGF